MSELKRVKRLLPMDSLEDNSLPIDNTVYREKTFEGLCAKKAIKPGMIVKSFPIEDRLKLEYEDTGDNKHKEFKLGLYDGIVVEDENGSLSIVSVLDNNIRFRGRFAKAYFDKTLKKMCKFAFSKSSLTAIPLTISEYVHYFNNSYLFSSYIFHRLCFNHLFTNSSSLIEKTGCVTRLQFNQIQEGDVLIKIIPNNTRCHLENGNEIITRYATTWGCDHNPFKKRVVFEERE